jgi:peptidase E
MMAIVYHVMAALGGGWCRPLHLSAAGSTEVEGRLLAVDAVDVGGGQAAIVADGHRW